MYGLEGKVAVVTGGAVGIGRAIAERLAREGCHVGIVDLCAGVRPLPPALAEGGVKVACEQADVGDLDSVQHAIAKVSHALGDIDILVNNAGILKVALLAEMPAEDWYQMFRVNVHGMWHCCKTVLPGMIERRRGRVINLASWKGKRGTPYTGAYCATKAAVISMTETLAFEVGRYNITVNAICPGMVQGTEMMREWQQTARAMGLPTLEDRVSTIPLGRAATVAEIANMAAFLASGESAYITGEAINVAGGMWTN